MANIKITELPEISGVTNNDLFIVVDSGDPYVTKKITWENLTNSLPPSSSSQSITIENSGNNRVLTSTGSTSGIYAENNLTFDGSSLKVNNVNVSVSGHTHTTSDILINGESLDALNNFILGRALGGSLSDGMSNDGGIETYVINDFNSSVSGLLPVIANSGDNRILTSTGSSLGINAESNATFDGTNFNISGVLNIDNIRVDGNTISSTNANGNIVLSPTGTGKVGIRSSNPYGVLEITPHAIGWGEGIVINPASNNYCGIFFRANGTSGSNNSGSWTLSKGADDSLSILKQNVSYTPLKFSSSGLASFGSDIIINGNTYYGGNHGAEVFFDHPENSGTTVYDTIIPGQLVLTRDLQYGIFNLAIESSWIQGITNTPANTLWNADGWSNLNDVKSRQYTDLLTAVGGNLGGIDVNGYSLIMKHTPSNRYWKVKFSYWQSGGGGGFSYTRQELFPGAIINNTLHISDSGTQKVGIGKSPSYHLDVVGTGNFSQNLLVNGTGVVTEAPSGSITYGRRDGLWVDITSPANLQIRRGTASEVSGIIPLQGEPVWDTTNKVLYVGDGSSYGGSRIAYPVISKTVVNKDIPTDSNLPFLPITLSPINSLWQIEAMYRLQANWDGHADSQVEFILSGQAGINGPDQATAGTVRGTLHSLDDNGVSRFQTSFGYLFVPVSGAMGYDVKISCIAKVVQSVGFVDFLLVTDNETATGACKFGTIIARRIE